MDRRQHPTPDSCRVSNSQCARSGTLGVGSWILPVLFGVSLAGCGARSAALPTDPGTPFADFAQVHAQLTEACRGVKTLTSELALAGRAGEQRLRGRVVAG